MLSQNDLQAIEKLLDRGIGKLEERITQVEGNLGNRVDQVEGHLGNRVDQLEKSSQGIQKQITHLRTEMKRDFKKVHQDQNLIIKHFNREFLGLQERVEKLEHKVGSTSPR